ncbi:unnamed protein product [Nezara viridula]|uniref:Uncharacterized protein n=1 Tax=Nezara viridula TaxID=85310 RepID=A0A9P0E4Y3_NEZVI|nr:unnamed protein product [Nezara viridula]
MGLCFLPGTAHVQNTTSRIYWTIVLVDFWIALPTCSFPESELDAYLCRSELQRLELEATTELPRGPHTPTFEEFFDPRPSFPRPEDDVFLKPQPLWEDITSSIQKLDPENAEMLASVTQVKMEFTDDQVSKSL